MSAATDRELRRIADALALLALRSVPPNVVRDEAKIERDRLRDAVHARETPERARNVARHEAGAAYYDALAALADRVLADLAPPPAPSSLPPVTRDDAVVVFVGDAAPCRALSRAVADALGTPVAEATAAVPAWRDATARGRWTPLLAMGARGQVAVHLGLHEPADAVALEALRGYDREPSVVVVAAYPPGEDGAVAWEVERGGAVTTGRWTP